jgi:chromosome segregation ATPase
VFQINCVQAQATVDTQKREKKEENEMVTVLKSVMDGQEKMMKEQIRMANVMEKMSANFEDKQRKLVSNIDALSDAVQSMELEFGKLRTEVKNKEREYMELTEENKRLKSEIEEQQKFIERAYLEIEKMEKSKELDEKKNYALTQKYKDLQTTKEKLENDYKKILENVMAFEAKFSEWMGKEISIEKAMIYLEIRWKREERKKESLQKELDRKTQMSQNAEQLRKEIENLKTQEEEMRRNKEEMERKMQSLTKANNGLKLQFDILQAKYNRAEDGATNYKKF